MLPACGYGSEYVALEEHAARGVLRVVLPVDASPPGGLRRENRREHHLLLDLPGVGDS